MKLRLTNECDVYITIEDSTFIDLKTKAKFIDSEYGEWWTTPHHVLNGHKHPKRAIYENTVRKITPLKEIEKLIFKTHGDEIKIIPETYISSYKKCMFIHKLYGKWEAIPNNVINKKSSHPFGSLEKAQKTSLIKYGTTHPMKNKDHYNKVQKSLWNTVILKHWKTEEEILCRASYEFAVVNMLNELKIDYKWQIKFILDNNVVYFCDLYLKDEDKYIEIKGYFMSTRNKLKWEEFHSKYKNSELWQKFEVENFTKKSVYNIKKEYEEYINETKRNIQ